VIHAAAAWAPEFEFAAATVDTILPAGRCCPARHDLDRGLILGTVELHGCVVGGRYPAGEPVSRWAELGAHHWLLRAPRRLPNPIECSGRLGLWDVPGDVLELLRVGGVLDENPEENLTGA